MGIGHHSATSNNIKLVHWPLMGGLLCLVLRGGATACRGTLLYQTTAHPSMVSVPITILLYDGLLLCSFNVLIKGFMHGNPTMVTVSGRLISLMSLGPSHPRLPWN